MIGSKWEVAEKVPWLSAYFPDPLVGFLPLGRSGVSHLNQKVARGLVELLKLVAQDTTAVVNQLLPRPPVRLWCRSDQLRHPFSVS